MTSAENIIWKHIHINEWKLKFRRQHPILFYIVDFYCHELKLIIEIDGGIHDNEDVKKNDQEREETLKSLGLKIIRFKNEQVYKSPKLVLEKIDQKIRVLQTPPLGDGGGCSLSIIKIGGNIIDDAKKLSSFLKDFAAIEGPKILVHGGGKVATQLAEQMGVPQQMVDGRRITDAETLKIVTMVYAGLINKNIIAQLQAYSCNAIGLTGADANSITAHKRISPTPPSGDGGSWGFAGDVDAINIPILKTLLDQQLALVVAPITHDGKGQLLNTNADTIAQELATGLCAAFAVQLIYSFEKAGVLLDADDETTVIKKIDTAFYKQLKEEKKVFAGMIPKLDNAFKALEKGVRKVIIGKAENLSALLKGDAGTGIVL